MPDFHSGPAQFFSQRQKEQIIMKVFLQAAFFLAVVQCLDELSFQNVTSAPETREIVALPPDWRDYSSVNISVAQPKPKKRVKTLERQAALIKRYRFSCLAQKSKKMIIQGKSKTQK